MSNKISITAAAAILVFGMYFFLTYGRATVLPEEKVAAPKEAVVDQAKIAIDYSKFSRVYARDFIKDGRLEIPELGISIDAKGLPSGVYYITTDEDAQFSSDALLKAGGDDCFFSGASILKLNKADLTDDGDGQFPKSWMAKLASDGKIAEVDGAYYLKMGPQGQCFGSEEATRLQGEISSFLEKSLLTVKRL
jgi:hypothetical protein